MSPWYVYASCDYAHMNTLNIHTFVCNDIFCHKDSRKYLQAVAWIVVNYSFARTHWGVILCITIAKTSRYRIWLPISVFLLYNVFLNTFFVLVQMQCYYLTYMYNISKLSSTLNFLPITQTTWMLLGHRSLLVFNGLVVKIVITLKCH